jgi:hypothetical protein
MYNVVFEGTGGPNSNYLGIRTWTSFGSKKEFDEFMMRTGNKDTIVAEGVTEESAKDLTAETSPGARIDAAFAETESDGGGRQRLEHNLVNAFFAIRADEARIEERNAEVRPRLPGVRREVGRR